MPQIKFQKSPSYREEYSVSSLMCCLPVFKTQKYSVYIVYTQGFPGGSSDKEPHQQCRRCKRSGFETWVGKILWRRAWQPTPVFLLVEIPMGRGAWWATVHGVTKSGTWQSAHTHMHSIYTVFLKIVTLLSHLTVSENFTHIMNLVLKRSFTGSVLFCAMVEASGTSFSSSAK